MSGSRRVRARIRGTGGFIALALVPLIVFYAIFLIFPVGWSFFMSLQNWPGADLVTDPQFVGLRNYETAFLYDPLFLKSLMNTLYYVVLFIPVNLGLALVLAVLINGLPRLRGLFRTLYFLPVLVSEVAGSILWRYVYQPRFGLLNSALTHVSDAVGVSIGLPRWLEDPKLAMPSIVVMTVWKTVGYTMVILLAGLQGIPAELYEVAKVDGSSTWASFRYITLPLLRPTLVFLIITQTIASLQVFTPMYVMTNGGPVDATRSVVFQLYDSAFRTFQFGYASAVAVILFVIILVFALVQARFLRRGWEY